MNVSPLYAVRSRSVEKCQINMYKKYWHNKHSWSYRDTEKGPNHKNLRLITGPWRWGQGQLTHRTDMYTLKNNELTYIVPNTNYIITEKLTLIMKTWPRSLDHDHEVKVIWLANYNNISYMGTIGFWDKHLRKPEGNLWLHSSPFYWQRHYWEHIWMGSWIHLRNIYCKGSIQNC